jgi:hypothetical protein
MYMYMFTKRYIYTYMYLYMYMFCICMYMTQNQSLNWNRNRNRNQNQNRNRNCNRNQIKCQNRNRLQISRFCNPAAMHYQDGFPPLAWFPFWMQPIYVLFFLRVLGVEYDENYEKVEYFVNKLEVFGAHKECFIKGGRALKRV